MGWKILGVFVGVITDITVSVALGLVFGMVLAIYLVAHGTPPQDLVKHATKIQQTTLMMLAGGGLGSFGSLVGGFVTGWIAGSSRMVCGVIMGLGSVAASIPFWKGEPLWYNVLGVVLTLIMATSGACLADAIFGRRQPHAPPV